MYWNLVYSFTLARASSFGLPTQPRLAAPVGGQVIWEPAALQEETHRQRGRDQDHILILGQDHTLAKPW